MKEKILKEMSKILKKDIQELSDNARFKEDLKFDSIDLVEMLMEIEDKFNIEIDDEKAVEIKTVGDFISIIVEQIDD